jgi:hypothetical protein
MKNHSMLIGSLALCQGCAVLDPYVGESIINPKETLVNRTSLQEQVRHGEELILKYYGAASDHERLRTGAVLTTFGSAAAGVYMLGSGKSIADRALALSVASTGALVATQAVTSPRRQDIYFAGATAVGCVLKAYSPVLADGGVQLRQDLDTLVGPSGNGPLGLIASARLQFQEHANYGPYFENAFKQVIEAQAKGQPIVRREELGATSLRNALINITAAVNAQLRQAQPNLDTILAQARAITAIQKPQAPAGEDGPTKAQGLFTDAKFESLTPSERAVAIEGERAVQQALALVARINARVEAAKADIDEAVSNADACAVANIITSVIATPGEITLGEEGASEMVALSGGSGRFTWRHAQPDDEDEIAVSPNVGSEFNIRRKQNAAEGTTYVVFSDLEGSGSARPVKVIIGKGPPAGGGNGEASSPQGGPTSEALAASASDARSAWEGDGKAAVYDKYLADEAEPVLARLTPVGAKKLQEALCVNADLEIGPNTRAALRQYVADREFTPGPYTPFDVRPVKELADSNACKPGFLTPYEARIGTAVIKEVADKLRERYAASHPGEAAPTERELFWDFAEDNGHVPPLLNLDFVGPTAEGALSNEEKTSEWAMARRGAVTLQICIKALGDEARCAQ